MVLHPSPIKTTDNTHDCRMANAVRASKRTRSFASGMTASDFHDICGRQLRFTASPFLHSHVVEIVGLRGDEQMGRIHAACVVAAMAHAQAGWNGAERQLPCDLVRSAHRVAADREGAVSLLAEGPGPQPARIGLVNLRPKTLSECCWHSLILARS